MAANKQHLSILSALVTSVLLWVGCGQKQETGTPAESAPPASSAGDSRATGGSQTANRPLTETAQQAAASAQQMVEKASDEVQALIEQTKTFLSEQNYAEAASGLETLTGMSLTPEQAQLVEEMKVEMAKVSGAAGDKIAEVKALVDEKKYQEASAKLAEMADVQLTPEQQQLVEKLKAEIQKGLSGQAVESGKKALGGLLQGN